MSPVPSRPSIDALLTELQSLDSDTAPDQLAECVRSYGITDESAVAELLEVADNMLRDDPSMAGLLARAARGAAKGIPASHLEARGAYISGISAAVSFDYPNALQRIDEAEQLFRSCGLEREALRTNLGRAQLLIQTARQEEAREACYAILTGLADEDRSLEAAILRARANNNIGISYDSQGQFDKALYAYEFAEREFSFAGEWREAAEAAHNRGLVLSAGGRHHEALDAFAKAAAEFARQGLRARHAMTLADAAEVHLARGDYRTCLANLDEARTELRTIGAPESDHERQMVAARAYLALNLYPEALAVFDEISASLDNTDLVLEQARVNLGRGFALRTLRRFDQANTALEQASKLFEATENFQLLAAAKIERSAIAATRGDFNLASALAHEALTHATDTDAPIERIRANLQIAGTLVATNPERQQYLRAAFHEVSTMTLPSLHAYAATKLAAQLLDDGDAVEATMLLEHAVASSEELRATVEDTSLLSAFLVDKHDAYATLARIRLDAGDVDAALALVEAAKGRSLSDLVTGALVRGDQSEPRLNKPANGTPPPTTNAITAINYADLSGEVVAFVRTSAAVHIVRGLTTLPDVVAEVRRLEAQWDRFRVGADFAQRNADSLERSTQRSLQRLYDMLVAPLRELLKSDESVTPLLIAPTGILHRIPFHALHDGTDYLITHFEISYAPSLAFADQTAAIRPHTNGRALLLAAPDDRAPGVAREVATCSAILENTTALIGSSATADAFFNGVAGSRLIHLACHGVFRADNPMFSALRLHDRWITATELLDLDLTGKTVVLSACESARSDTAQGDEILGLTRAAFGAGAATLVAGLWLADDEAAAELMPAFYRRLKTTGPTAALRAAQLELAQRRTHPYFWSPFVVIGHR
jgi:CHAT domain-containing protein/tetratricopeptide (TPR) repeat protein